MQNFNIIALRFIFYVLIIFLDIDINVETIHHWGELFSPYFYVNFPSVFYNLKLLEILKFIYFTSCIACALSFKNNVASILAFVSGLLFYFLFYSIGVENHQQYLTPYILLFFVIFENVKSFKEAEFIKVCQLCLMITFFHAGLTKIRYLGLDWMNENVTKDYLAFLRIAFLSGYNLNERSLNLFLINNFEAFRYFFYFIPVFELLAPLAIFKKFKYMFLAYICFQIAIYMAMKISFAQFAGAYAFFIVPLLTEYINILSNKYEPIRKISTQIQFKTNR